MSVPTQDFPDLSELERRLRDSGWTPSARQIPWLLGILPELEAESARGLVRALSRCGVPAARAALQAFEAASGAGRERLLEVVAGVALVGEAGELVDVFERALADRDARSVRVAARTLGKLGLARSEQPLLGVLSTAALPEQRAIVEALGKLGAARSLEALTALPADDPELCRRLEQARLLIARRAGRERVGHVELDVRLPRAQRVRLYCRSGLTGLLQDELAAQGEATVGPDFVELRHAGTLRDLLAARTALGVALVVPWPSHAARTAKPSERIADALVAPETQAALRAWTRGAIRFRVEWRRGQHRSLSWELARAVAARSAELESDPRAAAWELRADADAEREIELVPRLDSDPRFEYRRASVPAASHPTLAAALARLGGVRADDRVWDPFVGSGLELIERARLGPYASLVGSDVDRRALDAARTNLEAAGIRAELVVRDALGDAPAGVTLILTNPPMGRRVARDGSLAALLEAFVAHVARVLVPGGRMVWLSPLDRKTERAARRVGLRVVQGPEVDMGGFTARVQILRRQ